MLGQGAQARVSAHFNLCPAVYAAVAINFNDKCTSVSVKDEDVCQELLVIRPRVGTLQIGVCDAIRGYNKGNIQSGLSNKHNICDLRRIKKAGKALQEFQKTSTHQTTLTRNEDRRRDSNSAEITDSRMARSREDLASVTRRRNNRGSDCDTVVGIWADRIVPYCIDVQNYEPLEILYNFVLSVAP
ncbi:hypothetical protein J6590_008704 [Homalodisca vitripennis]|nr:hypothetical protein J6590_008704 [Homalodisca vitripennis]